MVIFANILLFIWSSNILKVLIEGGHIVSENIQFEDGIMEGMEVEVGGDNVRIRVIRRMLHRSEVIDLVVIGHNNHAARMLTGGALDTGTAQGQALFFIAVHMEPPLLIVAAHIAKGCLFRHSGDGSRLEHMEGTEQLLGIFTGSYTHL